ncbi:Tm-1-like ATP-binding domain-containing protein [Pusillimonas sp. ANT_WB101]|uniref:Tm-1-like ATP-binding domain-containing protein n=1 Tax=Pusillimonas sp. ANT_WB101 TaxID=2597356 RepID=UPI0011EF67AA|nr:Tm-1-like ATP-binding domain-containing protein [Pusillimonas sp. ANT_WB101]KAA0892970.1 UPF0261 family protein [Pusillimonas sp. ANT_WB101]
MKRRDSHVWVVGTFDTKADELFYLAGLIRDAGLPVTTVDVSTRSHAHEADVSASEVAGWHPKGVSAVMAHGDRGRAVAAMSTALTHLVNAKQASGAIGGMIGIGGSGGASLIAPAMHSLPFGMPKLLVSTVASGNVSPYVDIYDVMMLYPVTDLAGLNRLSRHILANAAHAMVGMVSYTFLPDQHDDLPALALTMFGVTTPCVQMVAAGLQDSFDCQVFHANGAGGRTLEALARAGLLRAIIDLTTTEVGQHLAGGVCDAGPQRLEAASVLGLPWIGSLGALDMINFGPRATVPQKFDHRLFHVHNAQFTLMRSTAEELERAGREIAQKLNQSPGIVRLLMPMHGLSALDAPGQPFHDPLANQALFDAIGQHFVETETHTLERVQAHINDPEFAANVINHVQAMRSVFL